MTRARDIANLGNGVDASDLTEGAVEGALTTPTGRRNLIINGAMQVAQRGTSVSPSTSVAYLIDRFATNSGGCGDCTITQENDGPSGVSEYSLKYLATSDDTLDSGNDCWIRYIVEKKDIENINLQDSDATLTLSFWVKSSQTGQSSIAVADGPYSNRYITTYNISSANTWEKVEVNIPSPSTFTYTGDYGLRVYWDLGAGSDYRSIPNTWDNSVDWAVSGNFRVAGVNNAYLQITGVQLEVGSVATPFEHRSYGEELALCQRYYYFFGQGTGGNSGDIGIGSYYNSTYLDTVIQFPVTMRVTPTLVATSGTDYYASFRNNGADYFNTLILSKGCPSAAAIGSSDGVSGTGGYATIVRFNSASASIAFDSEL
jgi:hypothetical protein